MQCYGTKIVSYVYDAWGNLNITYYNGGVNTGAAKNPFTYRGYYYDRDICFYYLQSRYYDPLVGRFINVDGYVSTGQGLIGNNMFAYCNNNPVMYVDPTGGLFEFIKDAWNWITEKCQSWIEQRDSDIEGANKIDYTNGDLIKFDYAQIPDYNFYTSGYYTNEISKNSIPTGRTSQGIYYELLGHYIVHRLDFFDWIDNDDVAEMGTPAIDTNAWVWEDLIPGIISGLEAWYYDYN